MMGACDLPTPPARTGWQRRADSYRNLAGPVFRLPMGVLVALGVALGASRLPVGAGMVLDAAFFLAIGLYCTANFWRCREAHCLVTGAGWTLIGVTAVAGTVGDHGWHEPLWMSFLVIWVAGFVFEIVVRLKTGSAGLLGN